jgi:hypothetical protein
MKFWVHKQVPKGLLLSLSNPKFQTISSKYPKDLPQKNFTNFKRMMERNEWDSSEGMSENLCNLFYLIEILYLVVQITLQEHLVWKVYLLMYPKIGNE